MGREHGSTHADQPSFPQGLTQIVGAHLFQGWIGLQSLPGRILTIGFNYNRQHLLTDAGGTVFNGNHLAGNTGMDRCRDKGFCISDLLAHLDQISYSYQWFGGSADILVQGYNHLGRSSKWSNRPVTGDFLTVVRVYSPLKCKSTHSIHPFDDGFTTNNRIFGISSAKSSF